MEALRRMLGRLDAIAAHAKEQGVRLMVDAEHSYFQVGNCVYVPASVLGRVGIAIAGSV